MIDQNTVDEILSRARIDEVVSDFISLQGRPPNLKGICPFHDDKSPSLSVSVNKNIFKCFACGEGGTPLSFVMKHENMKFEEAIRYLGKKYGVTIVERDVSPEEIQKRNHRETLLMTNDFTKKAYQDALHQEGEGRRIGLSYFRERGFREEIIKKFELGYAPEDPTFLSSKALASAKRLEPFEELQLCLRRNDGTWADKFRGRVIFPIHSISGKIVGFGGRILKSKEKLAKYINSNDSEIYNKRKELYGLFFSKNEIAKQKKCLIVEGYTDVLSFHQAGIGNTVASSGTALTIEQVRLIKRFTDHVTLIFDSDAAGIKAAVRGIDLLLSQDMSVKVVLLPQGHDPDSFAKSYSPEAVKEYLEEHEEDFIRFKIHLMQSKALEDPHARASMIKDIEESIAYIEDSIMREVYIQDSSQLLGININTLFTQVEEIRNERQKRLLLEQRQEQRRSTLTPSTASTASPSYPKSDVSSTPPPDPSNSKARPPQSLKGEEERLIHYILHYGELTVKITEEDSDQEHTILEIIKALLIEDNILVEEEFISPLLLRIVSLCENEKRKKVNYSPYDFLSNHPDDDIREVALKHLEERPLLSKIHKKYEEEAQEEDVIVFKVIKDIQSLKHAFVESQISHTLQTLKNLSQSPSSSSESTSLLIKRLQSLNEQKRILAEQLGDRIVTPKTKLI